MPYCIVFTCHVLTPGVRSSFERLKREAPADAHVFFALASDDPPVEPALPGLEQITHDQIIGLGYPVKCQTANWEMAGNLDLVFLEFAHRRPAYDHYWFVEYDVHWEGCWSVLFEHFRASPAAVLATTIARIQDVPHKLDLLGYPRLVIPAALGWDQSDCIKAFLPICRISRGVLDGLHAAYEAGLGGHYELTVPTVAAAAGLAIEDIGGNGAFVRPDNRNRFYFAHGSTYSHSPGSFVFRPAQRVLPRPNTLWHPVKPGAVPIWHPLRVEGRFWKTALEIGKPFIWRLITRLWFATRWRPLRT